MGTDSGPLLVPIRYLFRTNPEEGGGNDKRGVSPRGRLEDGSLPPPPHPG
jgi:hypothetical protein